jgi:hypothetical protein
MPRREDDPVARGPAASGSRSVVLMGGFALAVLATVAVFLTNNPQYLRIAVVAVAWAFVLAAFAAGRRSSDRAAAAAREKELRRIYERELDREVAARREYELELENELRRETEDAMRYELDALRNDIASLTSLRDEVARVTELRGDLAALSSLREEVARVSALRDDVASLSSLRDDLGQLAELRADMARLRTELTEQLSSEMLVERLVMRTQAVRMPSDQSRAGASGRTLEPPAAWTDDTPPQELTGGWPAIRLDEPRATNQFSEVRADRPTPTARPVPPMTPPAPPTAQFGAVWQQKPWEDAPEDVAPVMDPPTTATPAYRPSWDPQTTATPAVRPSWDPQTTATPAYRPSWSDEPSDKPSYEFRIEPAAAPPNEPWLDPTYKDDLGFPDVPAAADEPSPLADFDLFGPYRPAPEDEPRSRHSAAAADESPMTSVSPVALPPLSPAPSWELLSGSELLDVSPTAPPPPPARPPATPATAVNGRPSPSPRPRARTLPEVPPRRRRTGDPAGPPPAAPPASAVPADTAEAAQAGGRRQRRRYREDDAQDDVLSRVLRGD